MARSLSKQEILKILEEKDRAFFEKIEKWAEDNQTDNDALNELYHLGGQIWWLVGALHSGFVSHGGIPYDPPTKEEVRANFEEVIRKSKQPDILQEIVVWAEAKLVPNPNDPESRPPTFNCLEVQEVAWQIKVIAARYLNQNRKNR